MLERRGHDLASLRYLTQAGGAMAPAVADRVRGLLPDARLFLMYGQTEATSRISWLPPERLDEKRGSVGIPVQDTHWRILAEDGTAAGVGQGGEVCVCGPGIMLGYWNNPAATQAVLRDGWLHTGDLGYVDADGTLHRDGVMRLCTARDELEAMRDAQLRGETAYLSVALLARVIERLGSMERVSPDVIEGLFSADFVHLQELFVRLNDVMAAAVETECPACGTRFALDLSPAGTAGESASP